MGCGASIGDVKATQLDFKETKIPSFDEAFAKFSDPVNKLVDLQGNLDTAKESIEKLKEVDGSMKKKLEKTKNLKEALTVIFDDLKANKATMEVADVGTDGAIELKIVVDNSKSDLGQAVEAILALVEAGKGIIEGVPAIVADIMTLVEACKEFPENAKAEAEGAGLSGMDAMRAVKNTAGNLKQCQSVPETAQAVVKSVSELFLTIKDLCK